MKLPGRKWRLQPERSVKRQNRNTINKENTGQTKPAKTYLDLTNYVKRKFDTSERVLVVMI